MPLLGYPRKNQQELTAMSAEIIKVICTHENVTPILAKNALKMAADIIEDEMLTEPIL